MKRLWEILTFQRMISPLVVQFLFWAGVGGSIYGAYVLFQLGNAAWPYPLAFGPLLTRLIMERIILSYRAYDRLADISESLAPNRKGAIL